MAPTGVIGLGVFSLLVMTCPALAAPASPKGRARDDRGICRLQLKLAKKTFEAGKPILIGSLHFENRTLDDPITIWSSGLWSNHKVFLADEAGREVPMTDLGKQCRKAFNPNKERESDKNAPIEIAPGETYRESLEFDLAQLYKISPGKYQLQILYQDRQDPTPLKVFSNKVSFEVKSKPR